ncbi:MAG: ATP-binding cassette domain-containing protein, partial [Candidatus Ranarchaeia archaeon]
MGLSDDGTVLQVSHLTKVYGREVHIGSRRLGRRIVAVDDVSLAVKQGEIFGFLGPNGAGKTTTIRAILGYLTIQRGTITVNGLDHRKDRLAIRQDMG